MNDTVEIITTKIVLEKEIVNWILKYSQKEED